MPKIVPKPMYNSVNGLLKVTAQSNLVSAHSAPVQQVSEQSRPSDSQVGPDDPLPPPAAFFFFPLASTPFIISKVRIANNI